MAQILAFPTPDGVEWKEWEQRIRQSARESHYPDSVVEDALPRVRKHWEAIFEPIDLELPKRPVPGQLTAQQAAAIQGLIDASAELVVVRLQAERREAFRRLMTVEFALSAAGLSMPRQ